MLRIDGSLGEGGGQTVRTALTLAAITRREVEIANIRATRGSPGLRHDLLAVSRAVAAFTHGRLEGDTLGSNTLRFMPGSPLPGDYEFTAGDTSEGTGSTSLLLHTLLPIALASGGVTSITLRGGTHGPHSPHATYIQTVFLPALRKFGARIDLATERWGWAPHGVGVVRARVDGSAKLTARDLTQRGELLQVGGTSVVNGLDPGYAERQKNRAARRLNELGRPAAIQVVSVPADSTGGMLFLLAVFERTIAGFTSMASEAVPAESVADKAVDELRAFLASYSVVDKHLADQLMLYAALATGVTAYSTSELTPHTASLAELVPLFLKARVSIIGATGQPADIEIIGAGAAR